jgi:hypothetical protein
MSRFRRLHEIRVFETCQASSCVFLLSPDLTALGYRREATQMTSRGRSDRAFFFLTVTEFGAVDCQRR